MTAPFRCSAESERLDEPLLGTASSVRAFLLVESPGGWGVDAVRGNRLPTEVNLALASRAARAGVRLLMIRRHGRSQARPFRVFGAYADPRRPFLEAATLTDPHALLDLDLESLRRGRSPGLTPEDGPLFLVCTHGKHDPCCAERGRPVARALHRRLPEATWEVSHIGGDRFAANVLVLPEGLYYGRVGADVAAELAETHQAGLLDLDRFRGRSGYPFPVQAAEIYLRRATGLARDRALRLLSRETHDGVTTVGFADDEGNRWEVTVRSGRTEARQLTCRALRGSPALRHELVTIIRRS